MKEFNHSLTIQAPPGAVLDAFFDPDALAASVLSEVVGAMAIARAVSNNGWSEHILKAARDSIKARIGLVA